MGGVRAWLRATAGGMGGWPSRPDSAALLTAFPLLEPLHSRPVSPQLWGPRLENPDTLRDPVLKTAGVNS